MPYILYKSNGKVLATIADGSINASSTSLTFVGKNYAGYGDILNQNILKLLENFSNSSAPSNPLSGQLWYDNVNQVLNVYNGAAYKSLASFKYGPLQPINAIVGDFWFNTTSQQLCFYNGSEFLVIGPEQTIFNGTNITPSTSLDVNDNQHYILNFTVTDDSGIPKVIAAASRDEFVVSPTDPLYNQNFSILKQGITLPTSDPINGNSISNSVEGAYYFWGTAATARALAYDTTAGQLSEVHYAEEFLLTERLANSIGANSIGAGPGLGILFNQGLTIGTVKEFWLHSTGANGNYTSQLTNQIGGQIDFQVQYNNTTTTIVSVLGGALVPGVNVPDVNVDIGTPSNTFASIYINTVTTQYSTVGIITATSVTVAGSLYGNAASFNGLTVTNYFNALNINATNLNAGTTTVTNLNVTANEIIGNNLTVNGSINVVNSLTVAQGIYANAISLPTSSNMVGNVLGNLNGAIVTATNAYFANVTLSNSIVAPQGTNVYANALRAYDTAHGAVLSANATITGQWQLTTGSSILLAQGATLNATYADIAEKYHADAIYDYGTVLVVGGVNEVTTTDKRAATNIAGVVSKDPAYKLNVDAGPDDTHPYIALKGRVFCKVVGAVVKGSRLVTSDVPGYAEVFKDGDSPNAVIGISLEDSYSVSGMIEIKV